MHHGEPLRSLAERRAALEKAIDFAKNRAIPLKDVSIQDLLHEGHRV